MAEEKEVTRNEYGRNRARRVAGRGSFASREARGWLGAGLVFGFLVSFLFADVLDLPRDLFYGIYATSVLTFVAWAKSTAQSFGERLRRRWVLALGFVFAGVMAFIAVRTEDATARPDGLDLVGAVFWRGVAYGLTDGLLLSAFPILVVFAA